MPGFLIKGNLTLAGGPWGTEQQEGGSSTQPTRSKWPVLVKHGQSTSPDISVAVWKGRIFNFRAASLLLWEMFCCRQSHQPLSPCTWWWVTLAQSQVTSVLGPKPPGTLAEPPGFVSHWVICFTRRSRRGQNRKLWNVKLAFWLNPSINSVKGEGLMTWNKFLQSQETPQTAPALCLCHQSS